jgi:hypothetical protein
MKPEDKQLEEGQKPLMIRIPAELKRKLDRRKKRTGETLSKMVEKAIANLLETDQKPERLETEQKLLSQQMHDIANELRKIVHKIDKIAPDHTTDGRLPLNVVVIGKKQPWQNHPQKDKLFQMVRDLHRVGANLTMIASALRLEGLQNVTADGEWTTADIEKIIAEIKKERDYIPPLYSLPE